MAQTQEEQLKSLKSEVFDIMAAEAKLAKAKQDRLQAITQLEQPIAEHKKRDAGTIK